MLGAFLAFRDATPESIIEFLGYLSAALSVHAATEAAGKSIRLVLIASASKLTKAAASYPANTV